MAARFPALDASLCTHCGACEVACVEARYGLEGLAPTDAVVLERRRLAVRFVADVATLNVCVHCPDSPCISVCPHDALLRYRDGRVELLESRCTGCGHCISACPYRAIRRVTELNIAVKCDGCRSEAAGPACAPACPTGALTMTGPMIDDAAARR